MAVFEQQTSTKVVLDDTTPLTCTIDTAQNVKDHTEYVVKVQRGPVPDHSWVVRKRYSDFVALDAALRISNIELPLPPKKVFGNMEREFIAERQQGLQHYLAEVLRHPILAESLLVKRFLDPDNYSANLQEVALQHISMFFRSEPQWEVIEPLPDFGCRIRKQYFMVKNKQQPKMRYVLSWCNFGPDKFLQDKDLFSMMKHLPSFVHPSIYPVVFATSSDTSGICIRQYCEKGTLRDLINKTRPRALCMKKYGKVKSLQAFPIKEIRVMGRQILETLKYLQDKGFSYGNLHSGNIVIEEGRCRLLDLEDILLGLPPANRAFFSQFKKINTIESVDVYNFGHLLHEMALGFRLGAATCETFPATCPAEIRSVLESILTPEACKNGLPGIADLLTHPLFAEVVLPGTERPQVKIPSKLKEALRDARAQVERRLKEDHKVISQFKRLSKAQAYHMSAEEKKKRRKSSKKKHSDQNGMGDAANGPTSPTSPTSPTIPEVPQAAAAAPAPVAPPPDE